MNIAGMADRLENELFALLCDNLREGAIVLESVSGKAVYCNAPFRLLFGIGEKTNIDISLLRSLRKEPLTAEAIASREKILHEKGVFGELAEYISLEGNSFFVEAKIKTIVKDAVTYYLYIINTLDRSFFEMVAMGIVLVNKAHEIVTVNPFLLQLFGYEKQDIIGKEIEILVPGRFHDNHVQYRRNFSQGPGNRPMGIGLDLFAKRKDGTEFPVEISLGNYMADGEQYTLAFINDISIRKKAQDALKRLNDELESMVDQRTAALNNTLHQLEKSGKELAIAHSFQKAILNNAGAIIVSVNEKGIIQTFNPEAERQLGYIAADLVDLHSPLIFHDAAEIGKRAKELSIELHRDITDGMQLFFSAAGDSEPNEREWIYVRKDGTKFPVQLYVNPMKDPAGNITGHIGVAFNIAKTKKIESELQLALEKEKDLGELKSRFVTMASHEFRTPLSTILSSAYLVEKYTTAEDQSKRYKHLQRISFSVNLLTDILNDFLSVGKIEEGKITVRYIEFSLFDLVSATIGDMKASLKTNQHIEYIREGLPLVTMDPSLLRHIIMNLVSNASKFSADNARITVSTVCTETNTVLSVKDTGIGIAPGDQKHLMERFFRGANAVTIQGTGLGLHIVSKYSELMHGTVSCKSELDNGTEFTITFQHK